MYLLYVTLCIFIVISPGYAAEPVRLALGEYAPYYSENLRGNGIIPRIATAAFALEGIEVEYEWYPWVRAYSYVKKGRRDGSFTGARTAEREKIFYYSEPLRKNEIVFFHLKKHPFSWQGFEDMVNISIGGTRGYAYSDGFMQAEKEGTIQVEWVADDIMNFKKLLKGRIEVFPISKEVGYFKLKEHFTPEQMQLLTYHPRPIVANNVHLIMSKENKKNKERIEHFNRGLQRLRASGEYDIPALK